jgi:hypothetical protein
MDLYEQFEVFDAMPGIRPQTVRGREKTTGREVVVHLLEPGKRLLPDKRAEVIAEGEGFVVTSPAITSVREWLGSGDPLQRTGKWDVTKVGMKTMAEAPAPKSAPGEFTKMFQSPGPEGEPTVAMDAPTPPPPVPPPAKRSPLETPELPKGWVLTKVIETPGGAPPAAPPQSGGGEFTRMFQAPSSGAPEPPAPAPAPPQSAGEFTQMFQAPAKEKPAPPPPPPSAPRPTPPPQSAPGEFTRMFQAPAAQPSAPPPPPVPTPPASSGPGEFTRMFNAPPPSNAGVARPPQPAPPGEFNDLLQGNRSSGAQGGEFTRIFGKGQAPTPEAPRPSAPPPKQGAGDFTRMFEAPGQPPAPSAPPPPPSPPAPQYQAPQYQAPQFHAPQFQAPQFQPPTVQPPQYQAPQFQPPTVQPPQFQAPQFQAAPPAAKPATNYLPLVLILVGLLLVAVVMAVYFAMRK